LAEARFWHLVTRPEQATPVTPTPTLLDRWRDLADRLGRLVSPALAAHLLAPAEAALGAPLVDPARARASRLANRLTRHLQTQALQALLGTGIEVCCLKGFAAAHGLYPDPDLRTFGDLDLLVRAADLSRAIDCYKSLGFAFRPAPGKPWGFQSDASLPPLASPDGRCNIDLHVHPDAFPAWMALSTDQVFDAADTIALQGLTVRVPSAAHALVLAASNTAKDKMGPYGVRRMIDAIQILDRRADLDWREVERIATTRALGRAMRLFLALGAALGLRFDRAAAGPPPAALIHPPGGPIGRRLFAAICADWNALSVVMPGPATALAREALLCWPPEVAGRLAIRRLAGLAGFAPGARPKR